MVVGNRKHITAKLFAGKFNDPFHQDLFGREMMVQARFLQACGCGKILHARVVVAI